MSRGLVLAAVSWLCAGAPASAIADAELAAVPAGTTVPEESFDELAYLDDEIAHFPDPFESVNRKCLAVDRGIRNLLLEPLTDAYRFLLPKFARQAVQNAVVNLAAPRVFLNDVLQLEWYDAGVTLTRFSFNSTVGIGGLVDVCTALNLPGHDSDFGQTMALAGVPSGPYILVPLMGPTTARDGFGTAVDFFMQPTTYLIAGTDQIVYQSFRSVGYGMATLDAHSDELEMLEESSADFYAALRSAYYQDRMAMIWRRHADRHPTI